MASLAPALALPSITPDLVTSAIENTGTGADGRLTVWLPDGSAFGDATAPDEPALTLARRDGLAFSLDRSGSLELYTPVVVSGGDQSVVRARIPDRLLDDGVRTAWLALGAVALALVAAAAVIADRLARSVTRDATELAGTARALAAGEGDARAEPGPTPELAEAAQASTCWPSASTSCGPPARAGGRPVAPAADAAPALRLDAEAAGETRVVDGVERLEAAVSELVRSARLPLHDSAVSATCDVAAVAREQAEFWSTLAEDDGQAWRLPGRGRRSAGGPGRHRPARGQRGRRGDRRPGRQRVRHTPDASAYAIAVRTGGHGTVSVEVEDAVRASTCLPSPWAGASPGRGRPNGPRHRPASGRGGGGHLDVGRSAGLGGARVALVMPTVART